MNANAIFPDPEILERKPTNEAMNDNSVSEPLTAEKLRAGVKGQIEEMYNQAIEDQNFETMVQP